MREVFVPTIENGKDKIIAYEYNEFPFSELSAETFKTRKKKNKYSINKTFGAFDIESTTIEDERPFGFMYHWQICVGGLCCYGRKWEEFFYFLDNLISYFKVSNENKFIIYVHNLGFETEFIYPFLNEKYGIESVFARGSHKPMKIICSNGLEFRCSYFLSNMTLYKATTSERGVIHIKAKGDLDYKKIRTCDTYLDDIEFGYCIADVISLYEYVNCKLINEDDNLDTIPLTSTGYVRRDLRRACRKDKGYYSYFRSLRMTLPIYLHLLDCARGGNTHANRYYSGELLEGEIFSFDVTSSYPAQMLLMEEFPISRFSLYGDCETEEELEKLNCKYCTIFYAEFVDIALKEEKPVPYLTVDKSLGYLEAKKDNGRILSAKYYKCALTNIDWEIVKSEYNYDSVIITKVRKARKGALPKPIRDTVHFYFHKKCVLKCQIKEAEKEYKIKPTEELKEHIADLEYFYGKSKNKLNGIFGCCMQKPCMEEVEVKIDSENILKWDSSTNITQEELDKYQDNPNSFLYFAWGVFITALARKHLETLINACSEDKGKVIYCDTDSSKCISPNVDKINALNEDIKRLCDEKGVTEEINGKRFYIGIYENETEDSTYTKFKTYGAKKYAYVKDNDFHITISGVNKSLGAEEMGSIENFNIGYTFYKSGGQTLYYNSEQDIKEITINGSTFTTASNIGMIDSTYQLGITDEYKLILWEY